MQSVTFLRQFLPIFVSFWLFSHTQGMTTDHEFPEIEYVPELGGQQASLQTDQGQYKHMCREKCKEDITGLAWCHLAHF